MRDMEMDSRQPGALEREMTERFQLTVRPINWEAFHYYRRLARLRRYVEDHLGEPIPNRQAATVVDLKQAYFSQFFKKRVGVGFQYWLSLYRVCVALDALTRSNRDLAALSREVGFGSQRTFQRCMKRFAAMTPRTVRQRLAPMPEPLAIPEAWPLSTIPTELVDPERLEYELARLRERREASFERLMDEYSQRYESQHKVG